MTSNEFLPGQPARPKRTNWLTHYWDCLLLLLLSGLGVVVHEKTQHYELRTLYLPGWLFLVSAAGPLLAAIHFIRRYKLFRDAGKNWFRAVTALAVAGFVGLVATLPRVLLLMQDGRALPLREIDVAYAEERHYKGSVSTRIGIQYGDTLLRFESSRTYYFLLAGKHCIRAEIGQAAPGFYFVRNLQLRPGEWEQAQNRHRQDRWDRWGRRIVGTGTYMLGIGTIILAAWLLTRIPAVRNRLKKINR